MQIHLTKVPKRQRIKAEIQRNDSDKWCALLPIRVNERTLLVTLHQIKRLPVQSSRCTVKFIRSECNEGCDRCIYVTVVTCADTLTSTLCIQ